MFRRISGKPNAINIRPGMATVGLVSASESLKRMRPNLWWINPFLNKIYSYVYWVAKKFLHQSECTKVSWLSGIFLDKRHFGIISDTWLRLKASNSIPTTERSRFQAFSFSHTNPDIEPKIFDFCANKTNHKATTNRSNQNEKRRKMKTEKPSEQAARNRH